MRRKERVPYVRPVLLPLGESARTIGAACSGGGAPGGATPHCEAGAAPSTQCRTGTIAGQTCDTGSAAGNCIAGGAG